MALVRTGHLPVELRWSYGEAGQLIGLATEKAVAEGGSARVSETKKKLGEQLCSLRMRDEAAHTRRPSMESASSSTAIDVDGTLC